MADGRYDDLPELRPVLRDDASAGVTVLRDGTIVITNGDGTMLSGG